LPNNHQKKMVKTKPSSGIASDITDTSTFKKTKL